MEPNLFIFACVFHCFCHCLNLLCLLLSCSGYDKLGYNRLCVLLSLLNYSRCPMIVAKLISVLSCNKWLPFSHAGEVVPCLAVIGGVYWSREMRAVKRCCPVK